MVVMSGSSAFSVRAKWFIAAFDDPYAPHVEYPVIAPPDEVRIM
jgi:hypothetical protein